FLTLCRYVERNPLRAVLVKSAADWRWGSLWGHVRADEGVLGRLSAWPVPRPRDWLDHVNAAQTEAELAALRRSVQRGQPFGTALWTKRAAGRMGLESTLRPIGRPRKKSAESTEK